MKIGLLTYHHTVSYGATLQTYATCKALQNLGHEVELIDFRLADHHSALYRMVFYFKEHDTRRLWKHIYPPLSPYYPDVESLMRARMDYDCLLVGSDQTWNPNISRDRCLQYFLAFGQENIRRVSYASSFGLMEWPESYRQLVPQISQLLHRFQAISTREAAGQRILKETFGVDSTVVVDPTMLIDDYTELSGKIAPNGMFNAFIMNRTDEQLQRVRELGKVMGRKPVMTSTIYPYRGFQYRYPPGIGKWLRYIGGADFVVVDSFHALVFCLKYHRQFAVIMPDNGLNSRLRNLLEMIHLEDRYYRDDDPSIPYRQLIDSPVDYEAVDSIIQHERNCSLDFLRKSLNSNCL